MIAQPNLKRVAELEDKCRAAFDNYFHKCAAPMSYDQWRTAFQVGFRNGREDATADWADHMTRMSKASMEAWIAAGHTTD